VQRFGRSRLWHVRIVGHRNTPLDRFMSTARNARASSAAMRNGRGQRLFHSAAVKISLVRCVLLDVGSFSLLGDILTLGMLQRIIRAGRGVCCTPVSLSLRLAGGTGGMCLVIRWFQ
jgi:hypothetical protein